MKTLTLLILLFCSCICSEHPTGLLHAQKTELTERVYLSGRGDDDKVPWQFKVSGGMNAGEWTTIGVPSCWELQGFGQYQYGIKFYGKAFPEGVANETGFYKHEFIVPDSWRGKQIHLIFEASMTDTEVRVNGQKAGSTHQGAFYRFSFNITERVNYGKMNLLEVTVQKESTNSGVNLAERRADYWNFGGIFRPVFLEIKPAFNIEHVAIDAQANGRFTAMCHTNKAVPGHQLRATILDADGRKVAEHTQSIQPASDWARVELQVQQPRLWSAETPNRYRAQFELIDRSGKVIHQLSQAFGFRTIEVRESDGMYINGVRVNIRGVNRHSFRPESGRTLSKRLNIEDVELIKSMNMNAVRLSHYPADPDFLEACDSLGLYVMNELAGWHGKYDTPTGQTLIKSLVQRDVNHPSVIWWANGNEKGWNTELDGEFHKYDIQKRPVLHPQGNFGGFETMHYRSYGETQEYLRLPEIFMPTEFLHGLYDGGHGAGLYDYWEMMRKHPRCIGGFLWVLADEGVKRVDMDGFIDNVGNYGADGIVGPHHEKEGSYFTIKEIWNPVQIIHADIPRSGKPLLQLENRYDFLNLNTTKFSWQQVKFPSQEEPGKGVTILKEGQVNGPDIAPHTTGNLQLNTNIVAAADALFLIASDFRGHELWRWSFPLTPQAEKPAFAAKKTQNNLRPTYQQNAAELIVKAGQHQYRFCTKTGTLKKVLIGSRTINFGNGPLFIGARRADRSFDQFYNHDDDKAQLKNRTYTEFTDAAQFTGFTVSEENNALLITAQYKLGNMDQVVWRINADGSVQMDYAYNFSGVVDMMGIKFDYPEQKMQHKTWLGAGPYRVWQNRIHGTVYDLWENDYNDPIPGETFTYPEFKGYFDKVSWMNFKTSEGEIHLTNLTPDVFVGVYEPRDGRDRLLYTLPQSGISLLKVIPPVRNKVNATDLIGPSSQPKWVDGSQKGSILLRFK